jgi:hypothetical protein
VNCVSSHGAIEWHEGGSVGFSHAGMEAPLTAAVEGGAEPASRVVPDRKTPDAGVEIGSVIM